MPSINLHPTCLFRFLLFAAAALTTAFRAGVVVAGEPPRPNILWIVSEDHGPHLGCYGDAFATTPNVDQLAARGMLYTHCWSNAPVCAAARTTLITGLYGPATGGEQMRSMVPGPAGMKMYPTLMRDAGYYCTNNAKEDYNIEKTGPVWNESSAKAHWKNCPAGQPFLAVFNSEKSHESKLRVRPHQQVHDPAQVRVPAYHPDTPEVRQDWAQYYDTVTEADADAGQRLQELADAGLAESTIVFYYADHGAGMPRSKRWPCDSGLHVPLVVYIPEKFKDLRPPEYAAGGKSDRLVSFVDFAPTLLSLAGVKPPEYLQGHAFLGKHSEPPQPYVYGFRGRMDERYDLVRSLTDGRYVYLRNYMPHVSQGQHVGYQFETPTTAVWRKLFDAGQTNEAQSIFWKTPKAPEELYDLSSDSDEVKNLAASPDHQPILSKLRLAQQDHARRIRDVGFVPEGERLARSAGSSPYDFGHSDNYPFERVLATAERAARLDARSIPKLTEALSDADSTVRYWGALGLLMQGQPAVKATRAELSAALRDDSPYVRIVAAQCLAQFGDDDAKPALLLLVDHADWSKHDVFVALAALTAVDALGKKAEPLAAQIKSLPATGAAPDARYKEYVPRLLAELHARFK